MSKVQEIKEYVSLLASLEGSEEMVQNYCMKDSLTGKCGTHACTTCVLESVLDKIESVEREEKEVEKNENIQKNNDCYNGISNISVTNNKWQRLYSLWR